jgi:DNA/RNA endonuclease YhcR with UshA esterase domain
VEKVFTPAGNTVVLLNFAKNYKTALIGKIEAEHFAVFPDLTTLKGKKVLLSGKVVDYKGQPEIELTTLDSIRIVE